MTVAIERVAVLGAGTMGAAIAAHCANAGLPVLLLDIVPRDLTAKEKTKGLNLESRTVRDRIAREGLQRIAKINPPSFMSAKAERLVEVGNLEDDLVRLADCDWIVEAVVENLDIKRELMARVDEARKPGSLVTTNTSGLPIHRIAEGRSDDFRRHFFGTHFFNPPRYMKLLEVIQGEEADPAAVAFLSDFAYHRLGKGVVRCKDRPNFIGNRILSVHGSGTIEKALAGGYRFEEIDTLTGPLIGRPKTATFRLQDLVGIDVAYYVTQNLHGLIPDDPYRDALRGENADRVIGGLLERDRKGNKTGSGFYLKTKDDQGKTVFRVLDPETFEYEETQPVEFASVAELSQVRDLDQRLRGFFDAKWDDDRGAQLVRSVLADFMAYAAYVAPEAAYDLRSVDRAVRWGFAYQMGPFEVWDALGVAQGVEYLKAQERDVPRWVADMLAAGIDSFYRRDESGRVVEYYDWDTEKLVPADTMEGHVSVADLRRAGTPVETNRSASLHDLGEQVLLLEFHSKANAIDEGIVEMLERAEQELDDGAWKGLVIGNDGSNFCVGADLRMVQSSAAAGDTAGIRQASRRLQNALARLRRHRKPVIAAVHGMALGGGAEVAMGVDRVVAHSESYIGLVEVGVGLLPAGGGLMELVRRVVDPVMQVDHADPLPPLQKVFETVAMAKVSKSAEDAREMGFLRVSDRAVMHRDLLLSEARDEVLTLASDGYVPEAEATLYAAGRNLLAALDIGAWSLAQAGWASEHDLQIAHGIAHVLCGGDGSLPEQLPESHFLRLEAEAFAALATTEKTLQRIQFMLETGKPLRN
ncbi:MAG: 3-hydroxyacyl-CoA dehydrogenase/enoyl-CoA hydratase family protein [Thermoanaerobaculia bacterium]|nr:3-hydroxyacyl-CoA dehydrogenase/enoyl-CoA hydratase family protein [Thermoanaerobaculia bacterium]